MRTFVAFKLDSQEDEEAIKNRINRVKTHYYETLPINFEVEVQSVIYKNMAAVIIDSENTPLKWQSVVEKDNISMITLAPPPNWEYFTNTDNVKDAPLELLKILEKNRNIDAGFGTPSCLCTIDKLKEEIKIHTDPLGFQRLYEYRGNDGWFWSNRAGALPLLAGEEAKISLDSWEFMCYAGWFTDTTSPIENVMRVEPGVRIESGNYSDNLRVKVDNGGFDTIVSPRKYNKYDAKIIAKDMLSNFSSYSKLWSLPLIVDLSGGKDSRVCAAATIASGTKDFTLNTIANLEQEGETAKHLVDLVGLQDKHKISKTKIDKDTGKIVKTNIETRLKYFHHLSDGDITPIQVRKNINVNDFFSDISTIQVQGAAGEIGKATYYLSDSFYNKYKDMGNDAAYDRLTKAYKSMPGLKQDVRERANRFIFKVVQDGKSKGLSNLYLLDYYYLLERARRWLPQSIDNRRYTAFFSLEFLKQSFNLSIEEKRNQEIYNSIIRELVPEWSNVPFYKRKPSDKDERTLNKQRIWQTSDKEEIESILKTPEKWNFIFEEEEIYKLWENAINGKFYSSLESLFDRLVMLATYQDHLDRLNSTIINSKEPKQIYLDFPLKLITSKVVRVVVYDNEISDYVLIENIVDKENYKLTSEFLKKHKNIKYKFQEYENKKWVDITSYSTIKVSYE